MRKTGYDHDFYAWTQAQAEALRAKDWPAVDIDHLGEEIESLGNEQAHAVESQLHILCAHLLKWRYQPRRRSRSWQATIRNARIEIRRRLRRNPSLRPQLPTNLIDAYRDARTLAMDETGFPLAILPEACPWSLGQLQDEDFLPNDPGR
jgi:hypothetical protein